MTLLKTQILLAKDSPSSGKPVSMVLENDPENFDWEEDKEKVKKDEEEKRKKAEELRQKV